MAKTWDVIESGESFEPNDRISLMCPRCGVDAVLPFRRDPSNEVIAATGLSLVYDYPGRMPDFDVLPKTIKCRYCKRYFSRGQNDE